LLLPKGGSIQYFVYRIPSGALVAEVWGESQRQVRLALDKGRFLIQQRAPGRYGATEVTLTFGGEQRLSSWSFQRIPLKLLAQKGGRLLIRRHELSGGYGFHLSHRGDIGQRFSLGYGYRLGALTLCARALFGMSWDEQGLLQEEQRGVGLDLFAQWHYPLGPFTSSLGLGTSLHYRGQRAQHRATIAELDLRQSTVSSYGAAGPMADGSLSLYLHPALSINLGLTLTSLFYREQERASFSLEQTTWLGLSWGL
jgi:hypothetical protein